MPLTGNRLGHTLVQTNKSSLCNISIQSEQEGVKYKLNSKETKIFVRAILNYMFKDDTGKFSVEMTISEYIEKL